MGLLAKAIETYDANQALVGKYESGREPLAPICHVITFADIEITISRSGKFESARDVKKEIGKNRKEDAVGIDGQIIIPVTEKSAGRTGNSANAPHPLCEQLKIVTTPAYIEGLTAWNESKYSHPYLGSILAYIKGGTLIDDLLDCGIVKKPDEKTLTEEVKKELIAKDKRMIRWRVNYDCEQEPAVWRNRDLQKAYSEYYLSIKETEGRKDLCEITGEICAIAEQHPKKLIQDQANAKLISSNDKTNYTFRGRFQNAEQALSIGYEATQKAHNAIRWLISGQSIREGGSNIICWNPQGKDISAKPVNPLRASGADQTSDPTNYREGLKDVIFGIRNTGNAANCLMDDDQIVLASFEAATKGRLSVTYYNEVSAKEYFERLRKWDEKCCWYRRYGRSGGAKIQSPSLFQIVKCAYGAERSVNGEKKICTDDKIMRVGLKRLLAIKMSGGAFPADIMRKLTARASSPQCYTDEENWKETVYTACAVLQKYRNDAGKGGNELEWSLDKADRSFQFGRLLAAMDRVEKDRHQKAGIDRKSYAMANLSLFVRSPFATAAKINEHLTSAYLDRVDGWQRSRYEKVRKEVMDILSSFSESELCKPLEPTYLMGYTMQDKAFFKPRNDAAETNDVSDTDKKKEEVTK